MSLFRSKSKSGPRLVAITVNKYATPTLENAACPFSVGVMNLTQAEADKLSEYAVQLQCDRSITATEMREREKNVMIGNSPAYSNMVSDVEANLKREIERVKAERALKRAERNAYGDAPGFANGGEVPNAFNDKMEAIGRALKEGMISADAAMAAMKEFGQVVGDGGYDYGGDPDGLKFPTNESVYAAAGERLRREALADIERADARKQKAIEDAKPRNRFSGLDIE